MRMTNNITTEAKNVINNYFLNRNIVLVVEFLSHDGYDRYGPKSNLWDLYIIEEIENNFVFYDYHWEDWFFDHDAKEYELWKKKNLEDCTIGEFEKIMLKSKNISDKFDNIVKNLYNSKLESKKEVI